MNQSEDPSPGSEKPAIQSQSSRKIENPFTEQSGESKQNIFGMLEGCQDKEEFIGSGLVSVRQFQDAAAGHSGKDNVVQRQTEERCLTGCISATEQQARKVKLQQQAENTLVGHEDETVQGPVSVESPVTSVDATELIAAMGIEAKETELTEDRVRQQPPVAQGDHSQDPNYLAVDATLQSDRACQRNQDLTKCSPYKRVHD